MKVNELIEVLKNCPQEANVFIEKYEDKHDYQDVVQIFNDAGDVMIRDYEAERLSGEGGPVIL